MTQEASEASFDELARGLAEGAISRRQALKWAGYGVLGAVLSGIGFADTAEPLRAANAAGVVGRVGHR